MKQIHLIKLLSVLLCMVMLFAACSQKDDEKETTGNTETESRTEAATDPVTEPETEPETEIETEPETETETETEPETEPDTHAPVDAVLENFFGFEYLENWDKIDPETLTRLDVEFIDDNDFVLVYKTSDVDVKNVVTDTYTMYNLQQGKVVLELTHSYANEDYDSYEGDYVGFYEDGEPYRRYPATMMSVNLLRGYNKKDFVHYLEVIKREFTVIDEKTREENPDGCYYEVKTIYEYYDMGGTLIATANHELSISGIASHNESTTLRFGTSNVTFDNETMQVISVVDTLGIKQYGEYDVEINGYGYLMDRNTKTYYAKDFLEVYKKSTGDRLLRYYYNSAADAVNAWVLRNGDVLIQELFVLEEGSATKPDFSDEEGSYVIDHYILDVKTGLTEKVEFSYCLEDVSSRDIFTENYELAENGITLTENAVNIAIGVEFKSGEMLDYNALEVIVLDNDLEIMFVLDRLIPEHEINVARNLGIKVLKDGYYLIDLYDGAVAEYAVVNAKGEVTAYVTRDMAVTDKYIISEEGIHDFSMNLKYSFTDNEYEFFGVVGNKVIVYNTVEKSILKNLADEERYEAYHGEVWTYKFRNYYVIDLTAETLAAVTLFAEDGADNCYMQESYEFISDHIGTDYKVDLTHYYQKVSVDMVSDSYIVTYDCESEKYTLWNADLEHVLTTDNEMDITDYSEDKYLISTTIYDPNTEYTVLYTVSK